MSDQTASQPERPTATVVDDSGREAFLPTLFGNQHSLTAENTLYSFMSWLSPDYDGGYWEFRALVGEPLYMMPPARNRYRIACVTNGYRGEVSADAAGIIATLFTFSHLSFHFQSDHLSAGFQRLYEYAAEHPEAPAIFMAID